ncbi:mechanosensitive ion channel [candidate division GN15 bacterium]|nr:mechanosensitive ion channel [candidate division GN15 bacterium]
MENLTNDIGKWLEYPLVRAALVVVGAFILQAIARLAVRRLVTMRRSDTDLEARKRWETLTSLLRYAISVTVFVVAAIMVLGEFGVEIGPVLAAAGVVGIAIGFGAQSLVSDVFSGIFILLDDEIRVGDVVEVAGKSGIVERVNLRLTVLRDLSGRVHYIPNGKIDVVTNMTKAFAYSLHDIGVAYKEDVDDVIRIIKEVDEDLRQDPDFAQVILEPIEVLGLDRFEDSAVVVRARIKTMPIQQWRVGRAFNRQLKIAFDTQGIEIPFPHMTVYMGQAKDGSAASLNIRNVGDGGTPAP